MGAGSASASSAATSAFNDSGGNISVNQPNYVLWAIVGIVVLVAGIWFLKKK
jgi:uncharacterized membrane protein YdcZ (DUF606 family)